MVLDNLKDIWKNQKENTIQFSESDLYKMIHKRSTSLVKWIFYISIFEFLLFIILPFFFNDLNVEEDSISTSKTLNILNGITYLVAIIFIFLFYKNYKQISVNNATKKLMKSILKTRKTVKNYILVQLSLGAVALLIVFYKMMHSDTFRSQLPEGISSVLLWLLFIFIGFVALLTFWLFYKLIYGLLLKKLTVNYKELERNE